MVDGVRIDAEAECDGQVGVLGEERLPVLGAAERYAFRFERALSFGRRLS